MKHLRDPADVAWIKDATIRELIAQRFEDFCQGEPYDPDLDAPGRPTLAEVPPLSDSAPKTATGMLRAFPFNPP